MSRNFSLHLIVALVLAAAGTSTAHAQTTIYETGFPGNDGYNGGNLFDYEMLGVVFTTTRPYRVTTIGGHAKSINGSAPVFVAVLPAVDGFPIAVPAEIKGSNLEMAVGFGTSIPPYPTSSDHRVEVDFMLPSGEWALIYGSGAAGVTGRGFLTSGNGETGTPRRIREDTLRGGWRTGGADYRFFVEGVIPDPECGNGWIEDGEACDGDGHGTGGETASCNENCSAVLCGDAILNLAAGEKCDDGGQSAECDSDCTWPVCGDEVTNPLAGEACDAGGATATCDADCTLARCGDGTINVLAAEECDDRGESAYCTAACTISTCGDGIVNTSDDETCDDQDDDEEDGCLSNCVSALCGDGIVQERVEQCDNGEANSDTAQNACRMNCTFAFCGDGVIDRSETCDDGNDSNDDACLNDCVPAFCGDMFIYGSEQCDDGNDINSDGCTNSCKFAACGDGHVQGDEACDDGNRDDDDSCTNECKRPLCGNGRVDEGEECDDGNARSSDSCTNRCLMTFCGDGVPNGNEECDDGNTVTGDGCSATCFVEQEVSLQDDVANADQGGCHVGVRPSYGFAALCCLGLMVLARRRGAIA